MTRSPPARPPGRGRGTSPASTPATSSLHEGHFERIDAAGVQTALLSAEELVVALPAPSSSAPPQPQPVRCAVMVGNSLWLLDREAALTVVDPATGRVSRRCEAAALMALRPSSDGGGASSLGALVIGDAMHPDVTRSVSDAPMCAATACDDAELWLGCQNGALHVIDTTHARRVATFKKHVGAVTCLTYDRGCGLMIAGGADARITAWRVGPLRALERVFAGHQLHVKAVAADGSGLLVSGCSGGVLCLWSVINSSCMNACKVPARPQSSIGKGLGDGACGNGSPSPFSQSPSASAHSTAAVASSSAALPSPVITALTFCGGAGGSERVAVATFACAIHWYKIHCGELTPTFVYHAPLEAHLRVLSLAAHGDITLIILSNDEVHVHSSLMSPDDMPDGGIHGSSRGASCEHPGLLGVHLLERASVALPSSKGSRHRVSHEPAASAGSSTCTDQHQHCWRPVPVAVAPGRTMTSFSFVVVGNIEADECGTLLPLSLAHWSGFAPHSPDAAARDALPLPRRAESTPSKHLELGSSCGTPMENEQPESHLSSHSVRRGGWEGRHGPCPKDLKFFNRTALSRDDKLRVAMGLLDEERDKRGQLRATVRALHASLQQLKARLAGATRQRDDVTEALSEFATLLAAHHSHSSTGAAEAAGGTAAITDMELQRIFAVTLATLGYNVDPALLQGLCVPTAAKTSVETTSAPSPPAHAASSWFMAVEEEEEDDAAPTDSTTARALPTTIAPRTVSRGRGVLGPPPPPPPPPPPADAAAASAASPNDSQDETSPRLRRRPTLYWRSGGPAAFGLAVTTGQQLAAAHARVAELEEENRDLRAKLGRREA